MEINFKTINESIRDISFIEKSSQEFDLESSIAQCIFDINFPDMILLLSNLEAVLTVNVWNPELFKIKLL